MGFSSYILVIANHMGGLTGWRRSLTVTVLGALAVSSLPPIYFLPSLWITFVGFFWILDRAQTLRQSAADGWFFGFGFFLAGLHWISFSLTIDGSAFGWMVPFALLFIPGGLALFVACAAALSYFVPSGLARAIAFSASWSLMEWLRAHLFTGFPWNPISIVWTVDPAPLQSVAWFGMYGLGFFTVFLGVLPAIGATVRQGFRVYTIAISAVGGLLLWWLGSIQLPVGPPINHQEMRVRVVQPNISQELKWRPEFRASHLARLINLSKKPNAREPNLVIWPETAVPFFLSQDDRSRRIIAAAAPVEGFLITGSLRSSPVGLGPFRLWNSLHAIDAAGRIHTTYDKHHLVPFGEFVPMRGLLGISKITEGRHDFTSGPSPVPINLDNLPAFLPQICYEIIFPTNKKFEQRPAWILNLTNDAWFGDSAGPRQHLAHAQMRAVELGLPVARAANTGISAMIDPWGRIVDKIGLGVSGQLDVDLPKALPPTFYSRIGETPVIIIISSIFILALAYGLYARNARE
ncbi:MAG: apolipoprotein N-acyltransferase [Rhodospirillaceae bacterium]